MSYDIHDAWLDEIEDQARWPFYRWRHYSQTLRQDFDYFNEHVVPYELSSMHRSLVFLFNKPATFERLQAALSAAADSVDAAIDADQSDAYSAWVQHEVWLPALSVTANPDALPIPFLIECLDYVGPGDDFSQMEICAAAGIWAMGEWVAANTNKDTDAKHYAMTQVAYAWSEAAFHHGQRCFELDAKRVVSVRAKKATDARHAKNRETKLAAKALWESKEWKSQAEAAREISNTFHVVQAVAERWIREFKS